MRKWLLFAFLIVPGLILTACAGDDIEEIAGEGPPEPIDTGLGKIVFMSRRDGNPEIYTMNLDGSDVTRLTQNPGHDDFPDWSPDGSQIAYECFREGVLRICIMDADGSEERIISDGNDGRPKWSPDGSQIAFISDRDGNSEIYIMNVDGSEVTRVTNDPDFDGGHGWSPDGSLIAFASFHEGSFDIFLIDPDGENLTRITDAPEDDVGAAWSPDGARIAFVRGSAEGALRHDGNWSLYVADADGGNVTLLVESAGDEFYFPSWSPDGSQIVYQVNLNGNEEIFIVNADGTGATNITRHPGYDGEPDWSP